jgi:hypothetical protein
LTIIRQLADSRVLKSYSTQRIAKDGTVSRSGLPPPLW